MRLADVLTPAIGYAANGHPLVERANATIATVEQLFRQHWPTSAAVYLPGGKVPRHRHAVHQPDAGRAPTRACCARPRARAPTASGRSSARARPGRRGFVAEAIDRFCRTQAVMDTSGTPHRGVLTGDDMARWQARVEAPLTYDYGRYTVCKAGPWTQGPVVLQQLALLKGFGLDGLGVTDPDFIHLIVECAKLAYADRETFYGDPAFVDVPMQELLSDAYNGERRKLVTERASLELRPGTIEGFGKRVEVRLADGQRVAVASTGAGEPTVGRIPWTHDDEDDPALAARRRAGARAAWALPPATRCISTSSTRPATWCRRRRRADGCSPRRSSPNSASVSARARRCSGSTRSIRPR